MEFINPTTDYAFKKIFGSDQSKDILISFLNALIYEGHATIQDLEIINPNLPPKVEGLKDSSLDVKARLDNGTIVIIEMQVLNVESFGKRVIFNAAKTYALQLKPREGYSMLKPVIAVTVANFQMFPGYDHYLSRFQYQEARTNYVHPDRTIELIFIELPKFNKPLAELETLTEKWIAFMKEAQVLDAIPTAMEDIPEFNQAFEIANRARLSREEIEAIERQEMFIHDQQGAINLGRAEGYKEGKREIARQLLGQMDFEAIASLTGLTVAEVQALQGN